MRYVFVLAVLALLVACDTGRMEKMDNVNDYMSTWCDKSTGIVYLLYAQMYQAGLTVYLDEDGKPQRCKKEVK